MPESESPQGPAPTVASRMRIEAKENAEKSRSTKDWFRHDGKILESNSNVRLTTKQAHDIASKNKGDSDGWYPTNSQNGNYSHRKSPTTPVKSRIHSAEAQHIQEKVAGKGEDWFKHDENKTYVSPQSKPRLTSQVACILKDSMERDSDDWYTHDGHASSPAKNGSAKKAKQRTPTPQASENAQKLRPGGLPSWADYSPKKDGVDESSVQPVLRLTSPDAQENQKRAHGSARDWYSDGSAVMDQNPHSQRWTTSTAAKSTSTQKKVESVKHCPSKSCTGPDQKGPKYPTAMKELSRKQKSLFGSPGKDEIDGSPVHPVSRLKSPEAQENQRRANGSAASWFSHS